MKQIKIGIVKSKIKESQNYTHDKDYLYIEGETIRISKHSWDCNWYWGFGYIGNKDLHTHADIFTNKLLWHDAEDVFVESIFNNDDFWIFKGFLIQAYVLKKASEVYRNGGHCKTKKGITDIIQSKEMENKINKDLEIVLNTLWDFLIKLKKNKNEVLK